MGARLTIVVDVAGWTPDQLRQAVRDIDAMDDPVPIAVENVTADDVMMYAYRAELGIMYRVVETKMEEIEDDNPDDATRRLWL